MISLSSTAQLLHALRRAHDVAFVAYTLPSGAVLDALATAARRGARVRVRLEGYALSDSAGITAVNAAAIERLVRAGADAALAHRAQQSRDPMVHLKGAAVDGTLFLDDRNWPHDGPNTVVRDTSVRDARLIRDAAAGKGDAPNRRLSVRKRDALVSEAKLIDRARAGDEVSVESESFGAGNCVARAIDAAAKRGARVRLLVAARDLAHNQRERATLARLHDDGVAVKTCEAEEKCAVVRGGGWLGSANATAAFSRPDQLDWGLRTDDPVLVDHLRTAFERAWATGVALTDEKGRARFRR